VVRPLLLTGFLLVALVGVLTSAPSTMLLLSALVGLSIAIVAGIELEDALGRRSSRRVATAAGLGGGLFGPYVAGCLWLGGVGLLVTAVLAVIGGRDAAACWTARQRKRKASAQRTDGLMVSLVLTAEPAAHVRRPRWFPAPSQTKTSAASWALRPSPQMSIGCRGVGTVALTAAIAR
jgi:hypothetical protein